MTMPLLRMVYREPTPEPYVSSVLRMVAATRLALATSEQALAGDISIVHGAYRDQRLYQLSPLTKDDVRWISRIRSIVEKLLIELPSLADNGDNRLKLLMVAAGNTSYNV